MENLGSADSGKSTIAKQMRSEPQTFIYNQKKLRILHTDGFNEMELINYRLFAMLPITPKICAGI